MMRCIACGRLIKRAAMTIPAVESGPTPHPAGYLGPVCAARLSPKVKPARLFEIQRKRTVRRSKPAVQSLQRDWVSP